MIKVHYLRPIKNVTMRIPREIRLTIYVDDLQMDQEGTAKDILKQFPVAAAAVL